MIVFHALLAALVGAAVLVIPGALTLRLMGVRGLTLLAAAPALTMVILGVTAILADLLNWHWGTLPALAGTCAAVGFTLGMRAFGTIVREAAEPGAPEPTSTSERAAILAGVLLSTVPVWVGTGGLDLPLQRWDALFHLSALRLIDDTGSASLFTVGSLSFGSGKPAVYPAAWHDFTALLPGVPPTTAILVSASLTAGAAWVVGCAALTREVMPQQRGIAAAAVAAGLITATPMALWLGWGHLPNAAALAMVPGLLALALRYLVRARPANSGARTGAVIVVLCGAGGLGLVHPNATLALGALLLPATASVLYGKVQDWWRAGRRAVAVVIPVAAVLVLTAVLAVLLGSPLAASVTGYSGGTINPFPEALGEVVGGWYDLWAFPVTVIVTVGAPLGAWLAWRRGTPWAAGMLAVAWALYLDAAMGAPLGVSGLWYSSSARLSVVVAMIALPLGVGAHLTLWNRVAKTARRRIGRHGAHRLGGTITVITITALVLASSVYIARRTAEVYHLDSQRPRFVTGAEREMWQDLTGPGGELAEPDGVILGNPFSGTPLLYSLHGQQVVFPVAGQVRSKAQQGILDGFAAIADGGPWGATPFCKAMNALHVRYLYQDAHPYQAVHIYAPLDTVNISGAEVIAEAAGARLVRLPECPTSDDS